MREQQLRAEEAELRKKIQEKAKEGTLNKSSNGDSSQPKKRGRWDQTVEEQFVPAKKASSGALTPTWGDADVRLNNFEIIQKINLNYFFVENTS